MAKSQITGSVPWYAALAVGAGLIVFPDPATTALGTLIVAARSASAH